MTDVAVVSFLNKTKQIRINKESCHACHICSLAAGFILTNEFSLRSKVHQ